MIELSSEQQDAFDRIVDFRYRSSEPYYVLFGLAGTGKTTVLGALGRRFGDASMCTLSGKAASVLSSKTGLPADTIHSTFYYLKDKRRDERGRVQMEWGETWKAGDLHGRLVLLDECSMVNTRMARDMLRTGAKIVACGDPGQLPPVEGQQFFRKPDFTLKTIHRQALESPIIRQAHRVRGGQRYMADGPDFQVKFDNCREELLAADAIIVWTNRTRKEVTSIIRRLKGTAPGYPLRGEPVMCLKNAPDYGVFNGVVYTLLEDFGPMDHTILIEVDGREVEIAGVSFEDIPGAMPMGMEAVTSFTFGYVITCHKAQGSEWPFVLIIDEYGMAENRIEWQYTALTRASQRVVIIPRSG